MALIGSIAMNIPNVTHYWKRNSHYLLAFVDTQGNTYAARDDLVKFCHIVNTFAVPHYVGSCDPSGYICCLTKRYKFRIERALDEPIYPNACIVCATTPPSAWQMSSHNTHKFPFFPL